ncbi:MAG: nucleotidyltransferase family protein, partial [Erythrobacter sp.]
MTAIPASFTALVLAGSRQGADPLAGLEGYRHKALIELGGQPLLARVVGALRQAGAARIVVSCDHPEVVSLVRELAVEVAAPAERPSTSVLRALDGMEFPVVVTTGDHALLQPQWVRQLLEECPPEADLGAMLAHRSAIELAVPGTRRTYARFRDGEWSGCNLFLLRTPAARRVAEMWQEVEQHRKRPWKVAARLGLGNLLAYLSGRLTLAEAVRRIGRRAGCMAAAVP